MWVARQYLAEETLYLFNHKPEKVRAKKNKLYYGDSVRFYRVFESRHGSIKIDKKFWSMFKDLPQPIQVDLVKCEPSEAMFYIQKHKDCVGFVHIYIAQNLTHHKWLYRKETVDVDTYPGDRIPSDMFPDLKVEDGYVPIKLVIHE